MFRLFLFLLLPLFFFSCNHSNSGRGTRYNSAISIPKPEKIPDQGITIPSPEDIDVKEIPESNSLIPYVLFPFALKLIKYK
jgi:hypothetical protein